MASHESRKEAIRKFKERKVLLGVYAVRCAATGRAWVGASRNLEAEKNGSWFCLRSGSHIERSLQDEWNAQGESAFQFEILETLAEDLHALAIPDLLKQKRAEWVAKLNATKL